MEEGKRNRDIKGREKERGEGEKIGGREWEEGEVGRKGDKEQWSGTDENE